LRGLNSRRLLALAALAGAAASVARTLAGGQDLNFDLVTYHWYLGWSAFHDRLALDFLPAGAASYLSPLPYALLYLLDAAGLPPIVNAALHACIHSLALALVFLLARVLLRGTALEGNRAALIALWLLGAVAPVYWQVVGTSFADALASALVLAALWLAAEALPAHERPGSLRLLALGAALAGVAVGMRVHNAIFALALGVALLAAAWPQRAAKARALGVFVGAAAAAWLLCFAPWAWRLWGEFGSPLFPLFNAALGSPDYPAANLPLIGFAPASVGEALALPFRMAAYQEWSHGEKSFPDVRPALLVLSALACAAAWAYRRVSGKPGAPAALPAPQARRLVMLFFLLAAPLWLATSANNRYGLALFLLAGPVCGALLQRILPLRYLLLAAGAAILWQAAQQQLFFKQYRWQSGPWGERYFDWDLPPSLAGEPAAFLSFGYQTASSLAPRLHPASRHANLVGLVPIGIDHPGRQRIQRMIDAPPGGRVYGVFDYYYTQQGDPAAASIKTYFAQHLHLWGLDFAAEACALIQLRPAAGAFRGSPPRFLACRLRAAAARDTEAALRGQKQFERTLATLAGACPGVLRAPVSVVRLHGERQVTSFASAEYRLEFADDGPIYLQLLRPPYVRRALGEVTESAIALRDSDCATWFSRPLR
jgi:hypothetical protein